MFTLVCCDELAKESSRDCNRHLAHKNIAKENYRQKIKRQELRDREV